MTANWLKVARSLGEPVVKRSAEIEAARTLPADIAEELARSGLGKLFVPAAYGGAEIEPSTGFGVTEELAYHDGSVGWCQMIAMTTGLLAGLLPTSYAAEIYGPAGSLTGGYAAPVGSAIAVDGGIEVSGRWQWGSGTRHCTWIGGGVRMPDGQLPAFVLFERDDVELLDTWYVAGLKGTGSTDYLVDRAFVPTGRWVSLVDSAPVDDGPLYRFSFYGLLACGVASVTLGLARRSIDELVAIAGSKRPQGSSRVLAERASTQSEIAASEAELRSARAMLHVTIGDAWDTAVGGSGHSLDQKASLRLAATHATLAAARVVDRMYSLGGGAAVYDESPLQRVFRDVHVATQHAMVAPRTLETVGRVRLGLDTESPQL